jgi:hypothetical protein
MERNVALTFLADFTYFIKKNTLLWKSIRMTVCLFMSLPKNVFTNSQIFMKLGKLTYALFNFPTTNLTAVRIVRWERH